MLVATACSDQTGVVIELEVPEALRGQPATTAWIIVGVDAGVDDQPDRGQVRQVVGDEADDQLALVTLGDLHGRTLFFEPGPDAPSTFSVAVIATTGASRDGRAVAAVDATMSSSGLRWYTTTLAAADNRQVLGRLYGRSPDPTFAGQIEPHSCVEYATADSGGQRIIRRAGDYDCDGTLPTRDGCDPGQVRRDYPDHISIEVDDDNDRSVVRCAVCQAGDGTCDCDDQNGAVNPGAPEVCDGVDNDCDLDVDGDVPGPFPTRPCFEPAAMGCTLGVAMCDGSCRPNPLPLATAVCATPPPPLCDPIVNGCGFVLDAALDGNFRCVVGELGMGCGEEIALEDFFLQVLSQPPTTCAAALWWASDLHPGWDLVLDDGAQPPGQVLLVTSCTARLVVQSRGISPVDVIVTIRADDMLDVAVPLTFVPAAGAVCPLELCPGFLP